MTLESQDSSSDAINKFKKRKHEEHKANRVSNKYPEGFGGDDASYNKPAKRFESGDPKGSFRGGSRGSFRGGSRGSFRGGSRGSFRGGSRGSFRGGSRGSFRGSSRGDSRGSFRGGSRGSFRGDSRGSFRGSSRGSFKGGVNREAESNQPDEKTDWKKYKEDKKEVRLQRLKNKGDDSYELGVKAKKIWEELRQGNCKGAKREELCNKLMSLVQGKVKSLVFAHDTVRVIETLMAVGDEKHRSLLFNELKDCVVELSKSKFARFFVLKTLKYGTKEEKNQIIVTLRGHVVKLMRHKTASDIVELAYNDYANAKQRSMLVQEFYGPEFRLFHDENIQCLDDALKKHPEKREYILKDMRKNLQPIIEKGVFTNTMVHTLIRDYLTHCDAEFRTAIIETLREGLAPILHTRDGSRVAMLCLWHGTNRDRKVILKSFRTHYIKIALENHGHMVLLAAFDCMDDTEFMKKAVLNELMEELPQLVSSDSGMKVLRYLIAPRSPLFFHPCIVKVLEQGDGNEASKKDVTLRREELQRAVRTPILRLLLANLKSWSVNPNWTLFIGASLNSLGAIEGKTIFEQLAQMFAEEYIPGCEGHVLDIAHTIKMVTYIIRGDKKREEENKTTFCSYLVKSAESELPGWINCNRGCFLLVNLIETDIEDIVLKVKRLITPLKDKLSTLDTKGAEILLQKL